MEVYSPQMDCNTTTTTSLMDNRTEIVDNKLNIFPNPASNFLNVNFQELEYINGTPLEVSVFNNASNLVLRKVIFSSSEKIDVSSLNKGIYIFNIKFRSRQYSRKFSVL